MSKAVIVRTLVLALPLVLAGCGMFGGKKEQAYKSSSEGRPLEVPPDLDTPSTSRSLSIPATADAAATDAASDTPDAAAAPPLDAAPSASIQPGDESELTVTDGVAGTWRRVGLALERSGVGEIVSRDEGAGTYTVKSTVTEKEGGFFSRMMGRDKVSVEEATRVVRVVAEGTGSRIQVEDETGATVEDAAARKLIAAIKQRLG
jgi:uncharacterized lipoprotein